uniref:hypothetical protein n=1 Tax=uncultured Draconibacterium sp. TaxID=1573823 RepID=UPI003217B1F2
MVETKANIEFQMPNLLLIAGNGRNVGKTFFACKVIEKLSAHTKVCAIKISSHFHPFVQKDVLIQNKRFVVLEEKHITAKDSSRMLQAGAERVFFVMAKQEHLYETFRHLENYLPDHAIVCESGGLHQILKPGVFFFVNQTGKEIQKKHHLNYSPVIVTSNGKEIDFDINHINFINNKFTLNNE